MISSTGNLWDIPADTYIITTNGVIKKNGAAVMGRGCALQAKDMFKGIDYDLGYCIDIVGNIPTYIGEYKLKERVYEIISFPVKHHWRDKADLSLIERSAKMLPKIIHPGATVVMPRPGCGNGGLNWEDVAPVIEPYLDDRFLVVSL